MTNALAYTNFKATKMALDAAEGKVSTLVKEISRHHNRYVRVVWMDSSLPPAYLIIEATGARGVHFCDDLEAGVNCTHHTMLAVIAKKLGLTLEKTNNKSKRNDYESFIEPLLNPKASWTDVSSQFGLLTKVSGSTSSTTPLTSSTSGTSFVAPALANFYANLNSQARDWKVEWNEIQDYLITQKVDVSTINKVLERRKVICKELPLQSYHIEPTKPNTLFDGPEYVGRSLRHILAGRHLIYLGEAGVGKDTLINTLAWVFGYPRNLVSGSPDDNKDTLFAEPTFSNGESSYTLSVYSKNAIGGGMVNFAEFNALPDGLSMSMHSHFDENQTISLPLGWGNAPVHPHFLMIASGNLGMAYKVKELSPAFKSRFAIIRFEKTKNFKDLLSMKSGLMDSVNLNLLETIQRVLKEVSIDREGVSGATSLRGFIFAAKYLLEYGSNVDRIVEAIEDYILNQVTDTEDYFEARAAIRNVYPVFPVSAEEADYEASLAASI